MTRATISAVLPNYNHGRFLRQAIGSLRAQSRPFDEIIVVDDGSTDGSVVLLEELALDDPRIRVIRHPTNRGVVAALNTGLAAATGDFIQFAAADDHYDPRLVERLAEMLEADPRAAFACGEVLVRDQSTGARIGVRPIIRPTHRARAFSPEETAALLRRMDNIFTTVAMLYRRDRVAAMGGFDARLGPFCDGFLVRRLALADGFAFVPEILANWNVDDDGYSRSAARDIAKARALMNASSAAFSADPVFPAWYASTFERRWRFSVARLAIAADPIDLTTLTAVLPALAGAIGLVGRLPARLARPMLLIKALIALKPMSPVALVSTSWARLASQLQRTGLRPTP